MLLFWGIAGIIHAVFLPGAALLSLLGLKGLDARKFAVSAFILSLALNYAFAMLLIGPGFYSRPALFLIASASLAVLLLKSRGRSQEIVASADLKGRPPLWANGPGKAVILLMVLTLALIASFYHKSVFKSIDQILSWNRWAVSWSENAYPSIYGEYPQLIPIVKSIPYAYMGSPDIQAFPIVALELFAVFFLLTASTLAGEPRNLRTAVVAAGGVFFWIATQVGLADAVVGLVAVMAIFILDWARDERFGLKERAFFLYLAFIAAGTAAVIKQIGILWWPWFALIAYESFDSFAPRERIRLLWRPFLVSLALAAPWYAFNKLMVAFGEVSSNMRFLMTSPELYRGRDTFLGRIAAAIVRYPYYLIFIAPAIKGLWMKGLRMVSASAVFMIMGWLLFFSYSTRNLRFPVLLSFFALGAIIEDWSARGVCGRWRSCASSLFKTFEKTILARPLAAGLGFAIALLIAGLIGGGHIDATLINAREKSTLELGETGLTKRVNWLMKRCPGKLLTADGRLAQLPSVGEDFQFTVPTDNFNPAGYHYLIVDSPNKARLDPDALTENFFEEQSETRFTLYINKNQLSCIYK